MGRHLKIAAWLHVFSSSFVLVCVAVIWIAASGLASVFAGSFIPDLVAMFGIPVAILLLTIATIELVASVALLRGRNWPRIALGAVSCLQLFIFPIGTALSVYTFLAISQYFSTPTKPA